MITVYDDREIHPSPFDIFQDILKIKVTPRLKLGPLRFLDINDLALFYFIILVEAGI